MRLSPALPDVTPAGRARLLQALGVALAVLGMVGVWTVRAAQARAALSDDQRALLGLEHDETLTSFVVAGRDVFYGEGEATPIYDASGTIVGWNFDGPTSNRGVNTDTILYVATKGSQITLVAIPRDLFVDAGTHRINGVLAREGPDGLVRRVEAMLGLPVDHYAIVDLGIFEAVVDALGGVEVNVPARMYYRDVAGGLTIDLQPGPQVLDGEAASGFIRYRQFQRGDIDRLDNVKRLAYAMLARVKELNVRAVTVVPELISTAFASIETDVPASFVASWIPRTSEIEIRSATLPTVETERNGSQGLEVDVVALQDFLAGTFGGTSRAFADVPDGPLLITDASGIDGLGAWYARRLVAYGARADDVVVRASTYDPSGTRILATAATWTDADFYASLLGTGKQQVERLPVVAGRAMHLELVLGGDAWSRTASYAADLRLVPLVDVYGEATDATLPSGSTER